MEFIISQGNIIFKMNNEEKIPLYSLLLDFLNCSISECNNLKNLSKESVKDKYLIELLSYFLNNTVAEILITFTNDRAETINSIDHPEYLDKIINQYDKSEIESVEMKPLSKKEQMKFNLNELEGIQKYTREFVDGLFIEKKLNFGGIDVQGINYRIFYSYEYNFFGESYEISDLETFFLFSIIKCLEYGIKIKKCDNCNKYFVPLSREDEVYCDNIFSNGRTCKQIGYENKIKKDSILSEYRRIYKNKNAIKQRNKIKYPNNEKEIEKKFQLWVYEAKGKLEDCREKIITQEEFIEWLNNN